LTHTLFAKSEDLAIAESFSQECLMLAERMLYVI